MKMKLFLPAALLLSAGLVVAQDAASSAPTAPSKDQSPAASQPAANPSADPTATTQDKSTVAQPASQAPAAQDQSQSSDQPKTDVGNAKSENNPLFRGCLSGTKDNYILSDEISGKQFRLHSDKDIAKHVGETVEVRGTVKAEGMDRPADAGNVSGADKSAASTGNVSEAEKKSEIDVSDIKKVSDSCSTSSGASAKPESDSAQPASDKDKVKSDDSAKPNSDKPMSEEAPTSPQPK